MVTFFTPGQKGVVEADPERCSELVARSIWIDLFEPTREEELAIERALGIDVPTRDEMKEIELSRRLYKEKDQLFMTATILTRSDTSHPDSSAITFILGGGKLTTIRYARPVAFAAFASQWGSDAAPIADSTKAFLGLVDAIVERLADILEGTGAELDRLSTEVLGDGSPDDDRGKPTVSESQRDYKKILRRIGRASDVASRARESFVSVGRVLAFLREAYSDQPALKADLDHIKTVAADLIAMSDFASFLSGKVSFLLDATLGLISNEQNAIIKIVSVATLVFLPPTLVASIYGMNFEHMPELKFFYGYPAAIGLMIVSAILPYLFFKRKGWL
jgi:magnesium transporter